MMPIDAVKADDVAERICEALDLDPNQLWYITLSFDAGKPERIYVQKRVDSETLNGDYKAALIGIKVIRTD